jgi:hypothetical protein
VMTVLKFLQNHHEFHLGLQINVLIRWIISKKYMNNGINYSRTTFYAFFSNILHALIKYLKVFIFHNVTILVFKQSFSIYYRVMYLSYCLFFMCFVL